METHQERIVVDRPQDCNWDKKLERLEWEYTQKQMQVTARVRDIVKASQGHMQEKE